MVYSALIEALNLVLEKYLAKIQQTGNITQLISIPATEFYTELWPMGRAQHDFSLAWLDAAWYFSEGGHGMTWN